MIYSKIPQTDIEVSKICLGTMTYGQQNTEAEAHEQLDYAVEKGINFIDTAEMYSIPGKIETQGSTERYIGSWLKNQLTGVFPFVTSNISAGYQNGCVVSSGRTR